jgi:hypothetical protein
MIISPLGSIVHVRRFLGSPRRRASQRFLLVDARKSCIEGMKNTYYLVLYGSAA